VIRNRVGPASPRAVRHALERKALTCSARCVVDEAFVWRERHIGLVPVVEHPERVRAALDGLPARSSTTAISLERAHRERCGVAPRDEPQLTEPVGEVRIASRGQRSASDYQDKPRKHSRRRARPRSFARASIARSPITCGRSFAGGGFPRV